MTICPYYKNFKFLKLKIIFLCKKASSLKINTINILTSFCTLFYQIFLFNESWEKKNLLTPEMSTQVMNKY